MRAPNPSFSASILVDITDDDRIRQMKERLRKKEEKQEAIAVGMSSYIQRMKQEEELRSQEFRKYQEMLDQKEQRERERIREERIVLQDSLIRQIGVNKSRRLDEAQQVEGQLGALRINERPQSRSQPLRR